MPFDWKIADQICQRLADGESLNAICKDEGMPPESNVRYWALRDEQGFAARYAEARMIGFEKRAEELLVLSDTVRNGVRRVTKPDGSVEEVVFDNVERARLQVDTRKWLLSKMLPKVYGSRLTAEGGDGKSFTLTLSSDDAAS